MNEKLIGNEHASTDGGQSQSTSSNDANDREQHRPDNGASARAKIPFDYELNWKSRWVTDTIERRPYTVFFSVFGLSLLWAALWFFDTLNTGFSEEGGMVVPANELRSRQWFAYEAHLRRGKSIDRQDPLTEDVERTKLQIMYLPDSDEVDNVLTPRGFQAIYRNEQAAMGLDTRCPGCEFRLQDYTKYCFVNKDSLVSDPNSSNDTCELTTVRHCTPLFSPLVLFLPVFNVSSYYDITQDHVASLTQQQIDFVLSQLDTEQMEGDVGFFFDINFRTVDHPQGPNLKSRYSRTLAQFGLPICPDVEGSRLFENQYDDIPRQEELHIKFIRQYIDLFADTNPAGIDVHYFQLVLSWEEMQDAINADLVLAFIAGALIMVGISFQTGSIFIGFFGLIQIALSYPWTIFFYHAVLQIEFDTNLNRLAIFIILGIGADNIFIFTDAWKQSYHEGADVNVSKAVRLNWVWIRAASAVLLTSFTTMFAFAMTAITPLPAMRTFGIFCALMVIFNYFLNIIFFPAVLILWSKHFEGKPYPCCKRKPEEPQPENEINSLLRESEDLSLRKGGENAANGSSVRAIIAEETVLEKSGKHLSSSDSDESPNAAKSYGSVPSDAESASRDEIDVSKHRWIERYFYTYHSRFIMRCRLPLLALCFISVVLGAVGTAFLEPPEYIPDAAVKDSPPDKAWKTLENFAGSTVSEGGFLNEFVFFGVNPAYPVDRTGIDNNDPDNWGDLIIDPSFAANFDRANMEYMRDWCERVSEAEAPLLGKPYVARRQVECPIDDFLTWNDIHHPDDDDDNTDWSARLYEYVQYEFYNNTNPARRAIPRDMIVFDFSDPENPQLEYVLVSFVANILHLGESSTDRQLWVQSWDDLIEQENEAAPEGLKNSFHTAELWPWLVAEEVMVQNTFLSIGVSYGVALICLVIASQNIITGGIAAGAILAIVLTVIGFFTALGEKLDLIHAIVYVMLVGLSVDYVAHLMNAYNTSRATTRIQRTRAALLEIGVSVLGGAATTLTASMFLLLAKFSFFIIFGQTMLGTILIAIVWALFGFTAMMMTFAPNAHPTGDVTYLYLKYIRRVPDSENRVLLEARRDDDKAAPRSSRLDNAPAYDDPKSIQKASQL